MWKIGEEEAGTSSLFLALINGFLASGENLLIIVRQSSCQFALVSIDFQIGCCGSGEEQRKFCEHGLV